jgi:hypothetical protein
MHMLPTIPLHVHRVPTKPYSHYFVGYSVLNTLTLTGAFSLNEVHAWIGTCLPDVPPRITEEVGKLCFRSTFLQTVLVIDYMYVLSYAMSSCLCHRPI